MIAHCKYLWKPAAVLAGLCFLHAVGAAPALRIMCVGDSITAGYTDNPTWNVPYTAGYRQTLYSLLTNGGYNFQFVGDSPEPWNGESGLPKIVPPPDLRDLDQDHHQGYGWMTGNTVQSRLKEWIQAGNPHIILLMIGNIHFQLNQTAEQAGLELEGAVKALYANWPAIHLIVAEMTPSSWYQTQVVAYNEWIRTVLVPTYARLGMRITSVDQYKNLLKPGGTLRDIDGFMFSNGSHHLSPEGYARMARTWFAGIQRLFPHTPARLLAPGTFTSNGRFQATYSGAPLAIYEFERTTDLTGGWVKIGPAVTADSAGLFILDEPAQPGSNCFYRIADPYE